MSEVTEKPQRWHIDKTVPLAWIMALIVQAAVIIYGYAMLTFQVGDHDRRIEKMESDLETFSRSDNLVDNRITRIEEKIANQTEILQEIKKVLTDLSRQSIR
jgi:septal ring factor EnvC (AmiA/AmiB activator)